MRMKYFGIVTLLCAALLLTACDTQREGEQETLGTEETEQDRDGQSVTDDNGGASELREEMLELEEDSLSYNAETDGQPFFRGTSMTRSEHGYYFWEDSSLGRMMFWDSVSGQTVPLCNRPDCKHSSEECNAWFNGSSFLGIQYDRSFLQFYEGNLYVIGLDEEDYVNLYRVAEDGSSCEKYMELYKADLSADSVEGTGESAVEYASPYVCIHRGYVYFSDHKESSPKIRRMKLGGDEAEIVYETAGVRPNLYRLEAYGSYIFFQAGNFTDDTCLDVDGGIYAYNIETGEVCLVKKDAISTYIVQGSDIYYSDVGAIRRYSLTDGEDVQVASYGNWYMDFYGDETYLYIWDSDAEILKVYDYEGSAVATVPVEGSVFLYGGDGTYIFRDGSLNGEETRLVLKTADIAQGHIEWEPLY